MVVLAEKFSNKLKDKNVSITDNEVHIIINDSNADLLAIINL